MAAEAVLETAKQCEEADKLFVAQNMVEAELAYGAIDHEAADPKVAFQIVNNRGAALMQLQRGEFAPATCCRVR